MTKRSPTGFTIMELMIVVAILGVLAVLAIVYMSPKTKPVDVATKFGNLVENAARIAVRDGPVSAATAASEGSSRRTRIVGIAGPPVALELQVLEESPSIVWTTVDSMVVPTSVVSDGYVLQVATHAAVTPTPGLSTNWDAFEVSCFPNRSCGAATLFFSSTSGATMDREARVSVLPLGGTSYVMTRWN